MSCVPPLVLAVVPFGEIGVAFGDGPEPGKLAGAHRALEGACIHLREGELREPGAEAPRVALPALGEGEIGETGVLSGEAPRGLAVAGEVEQRRRLARHHDARKAEGPAHNCVPRDAPPIRVRRRHQKRARYALTALRGPPRDRQAAETVGDDEACNAAVPDCPVERICPFIQIRLVPVALHDPPVVGIRALPQSLPVARPTVAQTGNDKHCMRRMNTADQWPIRRSMVTRGHWSCCPGHGETKHSRSRKIVDIVGLRGAGREDPGQSPARDPPWRP